MTPLSPGFSVDDVHLALLELVEARLRRPGQPRFQLVRVAHGPVAVSFGLHVGAKVLGKGTLTLMTRRRSASSCPRSTVRADLV